MSGVSNRKFLYFKLYINNLSKIDAFEVVRQNLNTGTYGRTLCTNGNNVGKAVSDDSYYLAMDPNGSVNLGFQNSMQSDVIWRSGFATKDDLPNIFSAQLGTSNLEGNHVTTIKGLWASFPKNQVFACNLVDSNNFCVFGFIYGDHKYGAVLYLAYNDCGIVKCDNGTFSDTKL